MAKRYAYPAIFTKEEGGYSIVFPDLENCFTSAETIEEGLTMANDVLCLMLYDMEESNTPIPEASSVKAFTTDDNSFVTLVSCDTVEYRKFYNNKAIKKTLTIPTWMNTMAEKKGVNFSTVLQNALMRELNLV